MRISVLFWTLLCTLILSSCWYDNSDSNNSNIGSVLSKHDSWTWNVISVSWSTLPNSIKQYLTKKWIENLSIWSWAKLYTEDVNSQALLSSQYSTWEIQNVMVGKWKIVRFRWDTMKVSSYVNMWMISDIQNYQKLLAIIECLSPKITSESLAVIACKIPPINNDSWILFKKSHRVDTIIDNVILDMNKRSIYENSLRKKIDSMNDELKKETSEYEWKNILDVLN